MKLKEYYKKNKTLVWIFLIIVSLLLVFNSGEQDTEKKEGFFIGSSVGLMLFGGLAIAGGIMTLPAGGIAVFVGAIMFIIGLGLGGIGISNIISPSPSIPIWAYAAGFIILILIVKKKN